MNDTRGELGGFESRLMGALTEIDERRTQSAPIPRRPFWRRPVALLAGVAAVVVAAGGATAAVAAFNEPATFQAAAESVVAGDPVVLKGSGCQPGSEVRFTTSDGQELGRSAVSGDGTFSADVALPADARAGALAIRASCPDGSAQGLVQGLEVTVLEAAEPLTATLAVAGSAVPGGEVVIKGAGCVPGTDVAFGVEGSTTLGSATVGPDGAYSTVVAIPSSLSVGTHVLTAECAGGDGTTLRLTADLVVE